MMKKKVKEILNKLQPSHIAWLLAGVLLAEGFNWLLYKDIKRVTAPGLSSLIAVCALVLAIYSAFQVKKWLGNKVNEKGFKKCESIIDKIQEIAIEIGRINSDITILYKNKLIILDSVKIEKKIENIHESILKINEIRNTIVGHYMHLNIWGFDIKEEYNPITLLDCVKEYRDIVIDTTSTIKRAQPSQNISLDENESIYKEKLKAISEYMDKLNHSTFNDIFITSPSKKVE
ncbi:MULTISPECIES: hypothetical protein [Klebsiella pneumoniae complex]|uniref:hypothetical protein n=1 Tax=Klebsiella TaxID=570 RepID=UPI001111A1DF|nr:MULTISPECIES: hypothetical protein [Klebsiella]EIY5094453.1 hypothetical protein [Klebsiella quasipneumoniae]ELA2827416.1 hypothetical protein [Klebsiella variicola]DAL63297.1 MAG TPA_asm: hypothetical protein [Caudoviricetes sp.]HCE8849285.1 hypothetical protein [Klebsiella oxytoca]EMA4732828.1 hypothetical protein [Klebsiella variicola]